MCLALLPEMLMCSWSLSISCPVPSWSVSSFSSFLSCWMAAATWFDGTGGVASTGFTRPTWGSTGMGGRTGVTPIKRADVVSHNSNLRHSCLKTPRAVWAADPSLLSDIPVMTPGAWAAITAWGIPICWPRSWGAAKAPKTDAPATASLREGGPKTLGKGNTQSTAQGSTVNDHTAWHSVNLAYLW